MKNEKKQYSPAQGALTVIDQALNAAFTKGVYDRADAKVINAAMDVLAEAITPPAAAPVAPMKAEKGGKNEG